MWFPSLHVVPPRPNTANKIRLFVKPPEISTFPVKAFWPSFAHHSSSMRMQVRRVEAAELFCSLLTSSWSSPPPGRCAAATGGAALGIRRRLTSIATMAARLLLAAAAAAPPPHPTTPPPSALAPAGAPPAPPPGYVAIPELSDEFDGDSLDATKWSTDPHVIRCDCAAARGPYPTEV